MADSKEIIQERMLRNISDEYDKSEGSFFYDSIKPVAIELEESNKERDVIIKNAFVETATGEWLDKKVLEQNILRKTATKASGTVIIRGIEGAKINIGDKISSDVLNFIFKENKIIDSSGQATAEVECEIFGTSGNVAAGSIKYFPVTLEGLTSVNNPENFTNGYNNEIDEELRQRYYDKVKTPATSGNQYYYANLAKEITGINDVKVFSKWNGVNTVKLVLLSANRTSPPTSKINEVIDYIESRRLIGADITVVGAKEKFVDIKVKLTLSNNGNTNNSILAITQNIKSYFYDIAFKDNIIRFTKIGEAILNSGDVIDYEGLTINNQSSNIELANDEIPVIGAIQLI